MVEVNGDRKRVNDLFELVVHDLKNAQQKAQHAHHILTEKRLDKDQKKMITRIMSRALADLDRGIQDIDAIRVNSTFRSRPTHLMGMINEFIAAQLPDPGYTLNNLVDPKVSVLVNGSVFTRCLRTCLHNSQSVHRQRSRIEPLDITFYSHEISQRETVIILEDNAGGFSKEGLIHALERNFSENNSSGQGLYTVAQLLGEENVWVTNVLDSSNTVVGGQVNFKFRNAPPPEE